MIALIEGYRAGLYTRQSWLPNLVAGVIVGIVALPLSMAFAIASGARPEQGLYTAIIGGGLVTLFGGTRLQIAGPTGAFIAILAGITAKYGISGLQVATFMAGLILLLMGVSKMGGVIKFLPAPVIIGFTSGIGVIIFVGQWADFFRAAKGAGRTLSRKGLVARAFAIPDALGDAGNRGPQPGACDPFVQVQAPAPGAGPACRDGGRHHTSGDVSL